MSEGFALPGGSTTHTKSKPKPKRYHDMPTKQSITDEFDQQLFQVKIWRKEGRELSDMPPWAQRIDAAARLVQREWRDKVLRRYRGGLGGLLEGKTGPCDGPAMIKTPWGWKTINDPWIQPPGDCSSTSSSVTLTPHEDMAVQGENIAEQAGEGGRTDRHGDSPGVNSDDISIPESHKAQVSCDEPKVMTAAMKVESQEAGIKRAPHIGNEANSAAFGPPCSSSAETHETPLQCMPHATKSKHRPEDRPYADQVAKAAASQDGAQVPQQLPDRKSKERRKNEKSPVASQSEPNKKSINSSNSVQENHVSEAESKRRKVTQALNVMIGLRKEFYKWRDSYWKLKEGVEKKVTSTHLAPSAAEFARWTTTMKLHVISLMDSMAMGTHVGRAFKRDAPQLIKVAKKLEELLHDHDNVDEGLAAFQRFDKDMQEHGYVCGALLDEVEEWTEIMVSKLEEMLRDCDREQNGTARQHGDKFHRSKYDTDWTHGQVRGTNEHRAHESADQIEGQYAESQVRENDEKKLTSFEKTILSRRCNEDLLIADPNQEVPDHKPLREMQMPQHGAGRQRVSIELPRDSKRSSIGEAPGAMRRVRGASEISSSSSGAASSSTGWRDMFASAHPRRPPGRNSLDSSATLRPPGQNHHTRNQHQGNHQNRGQGPPGKRRSLDLPSAHQQAMMSIRQQDSQIPDNPPTRMQKTKESRPEWYGESQSSSPRRRNIVLKPVGATTIAGAMCDADKLQDTFGLAAPSESHSSSSQNTVTEEKRPLKLPHLAPAIITSNSNPRRGAALFVQPKSHPTANLGSWHAGSTSSGEESSVQVASPRRYSNTGDATAPSDHPHVGARSRRSIDVGSFLTRHRRLQEPATPEPIRKNYEGQVTATHPSSATLAPECDKPSWLMTDHFATSDTSMPWQQHQPANSTRSLNYNSRPAPRQHLGLQLSTLDGMSSPRQHRAEELIGIETARPLTLPGGKVLF